MRTPDNKLSENLIGRSEKNIERYGFNQVFYLPRNAPYPGLADVVVLVPSVDWISRADIYRQNTYNDSNLIVDVAICTDPNVQKAQLGPRAIIIGLPEVYT